MELELSKQTIDAIAHRTALILSKMMKEESGNMEMVPCSEAAKILHISEDRLRRVKDRYIYKRDTPTGPLLFLRASLYK